MSLSFLGSTSRINECYDLDRYPQEKTLPCACPRYLARQVGDWSSCLIESIAESSDNFPWNDPFNHQIGQLRAGHGYCGAGRRTQAIVCQGEAYNVSSGVCDAPDFAEEMCFSVCPMDCRLSEWTEWSVCESHQRCGLGEQTRSRYLMESSLDGGRDCPELREGEVGWPLRNQVHILYCICVTMDVHPDTLNVQSKLQL